jgi:hypothetical protein
MKQFQKNNFSCQKILASIDSLITTKFKGKKLIMSIKKIIALLLFTLINMNAFAEGNVSRFRLQLRKTTVEDTLSLSNCSGKFIGLKDSSSWGDTHLFAGNSYEKNLTAEWFEFSFSFTPNKDGKLRIILQGLGGDHDISFDSFTSNDVEIRNGSFEDVSADGKPKYIMNTEAGAVISDADQAKEGKNYIKLSDEKRFSFVVDVKENTPVTISFFAKKVMQDDSDF